MKTKNNGSDYAPIIVTIGLILIIFLTFLHVNKNYIPKDIITSEQIKCEKISRYKKIETIYDMDFGCLKKTGNTYSNFVF